jgi:hypothetical protein
LSIESRGNLVVDSHVQNEGNGWAGSGANPWHLDEDTESILFLTNESGQPVRVGSKVSANSVTYEVAEGGHSTVILRSPVLWDDEGSRQSLNAEILRSPETRCITRFH